MSKIKAFIKKYVPVFALVAAALLILTLVFAAIAEGSSAFAEFIDFGISDILRRALALVTGFLPFSLAEMLLLLVPLILTFIVVITVKVVKDKLRLIRFSVGTLAIFAFVYSSYFFTLGVAYKTPSLSGYLELDECEITAQNLSEAMHILKSEAEALLDDIEYMESGSSVCPLSVAELSREISKGYSRLIADYEKLPISDFSSRAKPVLMSRGLSAFEILGIYTFFTGESNVNTYYPDYTLPFTVAHEFAHQRGIGRENEANFLAFLVCIRTDDPYIRYSGYVNMYEYIASSLRKTDKDALSAIYDSTDDRIIGELVAYSEFYYANKNELLSEISDATNDWYLKNQGTEGVISYGLVTKLCIYYFNTEKPR